MFGMPQPPTKIDPNQIPRPIPSSSPIVYETRHGNSANPPPPATSDYIVRDTGNCTPRYMRCTTNSGHNKLYKLIVVVDFGESGHVRCSRCKGYINHFMKFIDQERKFICNLCGQPLEYFVLTCFFVLRTQCRQHLELLLENIPTMFQSSTIAESCFGAAIKVSHYKVIPL
ncbi:hypothetical protein GOBAR_AA04442 [Gossypium barbadense]|uniref:Zinc finger Sec23/Sec24-type domain-containing protein n=1 Tax=Gossypium barbadense TaxID=3634 RepID=A0A2P5YKM8_GOSBA|nr:hypothetical protein GOBAR_AA04442 [Gossypium barbadense]